MPWDRRAELAGTLIPIGPTFASQTTTHHYMSTFDNETMQSRVTRAAHSRGT
jgi:hypothetical protein